MLNGRVVMNNELERTWLWLLFLCYPRVHLKISWNIAKIVLL